ncbi:hypothetical protein E2C01_046172 [Portunus trituberculatus]|uniref:Uncharacterized protein n=1 Tax=Portunus trituberculatus TaxID=210409 RepID=A0A5B7G567_PORTR|nr:hypothetical protein [Portunus trituberculatus]
MILLTLSTTCAVHLANDFITPPLSTSTSTFTCTRYEKKKKENRHRKSLQRAVGKRTMREEAKEFEYELSTTYTLTPSSLTPHFPALRIDNTPYHSPFDLSLRERGLSRGQTRHHSSTSALPPPDPFPAPSFPS